MPCECGYSSVSGSVGSMGSHGIAVVRVTGTTAANSNGESRRIVVCALLAPRPCVKVDVGEQ